MDLLTPLIQISTDPLSFFEFLVIGVWPWSYLPKQGCLVFPSGDSLLFTLGLMSANDNIDIRILIPVLIVATILGDHFSYFWEEIFWLDKSKYKRLWLEDHHLDKAQNFYDAHGGKTILFCKFIPFIRTFAPLSPPLQKWILCVLCCLILSGHFVDYNDHLCWHYLGKTTAFDIKAYFHYFVIFLMLLLLSPFIFKVFKRRHNYGLKIKAYDIANRPSQFRDDEFGKKFLPEGCNTRGVCWSLCRWSIP